MPVNVGIMKFDGNLLHDHTDDAPRNSARDKIASGGATGIDMRIIRPAKTCMPPPTYPNSSLYASRLCSDRVIGASLRLDRDRGFVDDALVETEGTNHRVGADDGTDDHL